MIISQRPSSPKRRRNSEMSPIYTFCVQAVVSGPSITSTTMDDMTGDPQEGGQYFLSPVSVGVVHKVVGSSLCLSDLPQIILLNIQVLSLPNQDNLKERCGKGEFDLSNSVPPTEKKRSRVPCV